MSIKTTFQSLESCCLGRCSKDRKCSGTDQNIWFNKLYHHICCICLLVHYTPLYSCVQCCCFSPKPLTRKLNFCYWTPKKCQLSQIMQTCKALAVSQIKDISSAFFKLQNKQLDSLGNELFYTFSSYSLSPKSCADRLPSLSQQLFLHLVEKQLNM